MRIITTREFRENQKSYFDLAETEKIVVHRGKNRKPVLLMPIEEDASSDTLLSRNPCAFSSEELIREVKQALGEAKKGLGKTNEELKLKYLR